MRKFTIINSRIFFFIFCLLRSYILRNIDQNRTRSSHLRNTECLTDRICKLVYIFNDKAVLRDRHCHSGDINLLKAVLSKKRYSYITGDCDNRNRIHISCGNSRHKVSCSRTAGCQTYAYFSCCSRISVCCMGCSLFMGGQDMSDLITMLV